MSNQDSYVAVCGPQKATPAELEWAKKVGQMMASHQITVLCTGTGTQSIGAWAAGGVRSNGGVAIGVLPQDRSQAIPSLSYSIPTGMGEAHAQLLIRSADVLLAIGSGWSSLPEAALALRLGRPVVALGGGRLQKQIKEFKDLIVQTEDPQDAFWQVYRVLGLGKRA